MPKSGTRRQACQQWGVFFPWRKRNIYFTLAKCLVMSLTGDTIMGVCKYTRQKHHLAQIYYIGAGFRERSLKHFRQIMWHAFLRHRVSCVPGKVYPCRKRLAHLLRPRFTWGTTPCWCSSGKVSSLVSALTWKRSHVWRVNVTYVLWWHAQNTVHSKHPHGVVFKVWV